MNHYAKINMLLSTECAPALLSFRYSGVVRISYFYSGLLFMVESDQTETEKRTGTVTRMKEKNPESENHVNKGTPAKHVMTDHERETEIETEGTEKNQKRESEIEQGTERSQRKVIEEVEAEIDHLTDGKAGSRDILKIVPPRSVHRI